LAVKDVPPPPPPTPIKIDTQTNFLTEGLYAITDISTREAAEIKNVANEHTAQD
jgi:hypothetical protein